MLRSTSEAQLNRATAHAAVRIGVLEDERDALARKLEVTRHVELAQLQAARADVQYWRERAERLIDASIAKSGLSSAPIMETIAPAEPSASPFAGMMLSEKPRAETVDAG